MSTTTATIDQALSQGGVVDITTVGRKSGEPHRIEIVFFDLGGHKIISGMPGKRGWYANLMADPRFTLHLKQGSKADLPARARLITDEDERRALLEPITRQWNQVARLEDFVARSPVIEFEIIESSPSA